MDDATLELLSRYVDGDLGEEERAALVRRLADEEELQHRLDALERGRAEVAALAARDQPPRSLDALVEPLRRAPARPAVVRPVFRWLAAAASVAAAGLLALQLARQHPAPAAPAEIAAPRAPAPQPSPGHYYRLQPLPRSADADQAPLGMSERLLRDGPATPVPEPLPPLEVMGPLDAPRPKTSEGRDALGKGARRQVEAPAEERVQEEKAVAARAEPRGDETHQEGAPVSGRAANVTSAASVAANTVLVVRSELGPVRLTIAGLAPETPPLDLVVEVRGGRIVRVRPAGGDPSVPDRVVAAVVGTVASGLEDGTFPARLAGGGPK